MKKSEKVAEKIIGKVWPDVIGSVHKDDKVWLSQKIKEFAALLESAYPEMEPVGWCVFNENGTLYIPLEEDRPRIYQEYLPMLNIFKSSGYAVEQVYREVKDDRNK